MRLTLQSLQPDDGLPVLTMMMAKMSGVYETTKSLRERCLTAADGMTG